MTFRVTDALLSPIGLSILTGAGLFQASDSSEELVRIHDSQFVYTDASGKADLTDVLGDNTIDGKAPVFVQEVDEGGSLTGNLLTGFAVDSNKKSLTSSSAANKFVHVDYYYTKKASKVSEIQIDLSSISGFFYVEALTNFRRTDGVDLAAVITLPNVKIQSNFTLTMASSGEPSSFEFVMDAFPDYTMFDRSKKVLCVLQIIDEEIIDNSASASVMKANAGFLIEESAADSTTDNGDAPVSE